MGSFFCVKIFFKKFSKVVYKLHFSVLIYGEVKQNIDFTAAFI